MVQKFSIEMVKPKNLDDAKNIVDSLFDGVPVIVNLEETAEEKTRQIIDYIRGTSTAAGFKNEQIGQKIFIFTPGNVEVAAVD